MSIIDLIRQSLSDPARLKQLKTEVTRRERLIRDVVELDRRAMTLPESVSEKELRLLESILGWHANDAR